MSCHWGEGGGQAGYGHSTAQVLIKSASGIWALTSLTPSAHYCFLIELFFRSKDPAIQWIWAFWDLQLTLPEMNDEILRFSNTFSNVYVWKEKTKHTLWPNQKNWGWGGREERMLWRGEGTQSWFVSERMGWAGSEVKLVRGPLSHQGHMWLVTQWFEKPKSGVYMQCANSTQILNKNFPQSGQTSSSEIDPLILNRLFLFHIRFVKDVNTIWFPLSPFLFLSKSLK